MTDSEDNPLGVRYIATTYVPGKPKTPDEWTDDDLFRLAGKLAVLHQTVRTDFHGDVDAPVPGPLDLPAELDASWAWWRERQPELAGEPFVAGVAPLVRAYVAERAGTVAGLTSFCLVHGDLAATNVVFDDGEPRLIDWEWSQFSDPARDLALIGGEVYGGPWYVPLTPARGEAFVARYAALMGLDAAQTRDLRRRRDAWMAYERFNSALHFSMKARERPDSLYAGASATIWRTLQAFLTPCRDGR